MEKEIKFLQMLLAEIHNSLLFTEQCKLRKSLIGGETSLVLSPDSEFFKFFGKSVSPAIKKR